MTKPEIILIGAGGHALSCIDVIEQEDKFKIAGLIGKKEELGRKVCGYNIIGIDNDLVDLFKQYKNAHISIGKINTDIRNNIFIQTTKIGFSMPTITSPNAYVSDYADIGDGSIIMHGVIINAGVNIGNNCIINSKALIEHHVQIEDGCHVSTNCIINGNVKIGTGTFIGSSACIKNNISIGKNSVIGMGLSVRKDLEDRSRFTG
ncbi:MAG: acetyltransferase [Nitrosomonadales bacterium]|nr:acetyltransferase [Nitrosomonadales bacterium]|tara:strand:- start:852 stop:1466 length:615 start_codon:yes stop_codon:yes gene_type:complete